MNNILSIDLEEWYHAEYVRCCAPKDKVERLIPSLARTLDLLSKYGAEVTFFVVGELVERYPGLLEEITSRGHEIAFHGYHHKPLWELNAETLRLEIERFNSLSRQRCQGFRAPSFSLDNSTKWALGALESSGISYDSSIFPVKTPMYGVPKAPLSPYRPSHEDVSKKDDNTILLEFPPLVYQWSRLKIPAAGGFYLRALPLGLIKRAIGKMNKQDAPAVIYAHNWEIDSETPRVKIGLYRSFITYYGIRGTEGKLSSLMSEFQFTSFTNYLHDAGFA